MGNKSAGPIEELGGRLRDWARRLGFHKELHVSSLQLMALAVPLVVAPRLLYSAVDLPKRILLELLVMAAWLGVFAGATRGKSFAFRGAGAALPILAIPGWTFLASIPATNACLALELAGLQLSFAGLALIVGFSFGREDLRKVLGALLAAAGIEALYGILQYAGVDFLPWDSSWGLRCFGTIGNPVFFAEFLAPVFVFAVACWLREEGEERRDLLSLLVLALFLALVLSQTRGAWLGSAAGLGALIIGLWRYVPGGGDLLVRNRGWMAAFLGFGLAVILTISSKTILGTNSLPLKDRLTDAVNIRSWTIQHRLVLWRAAAVILRDSPLAGAGPGHYRSAFPLAQATFRDGYTKRGFMFAPKETNAHNDYAQLAAEQGLIGLGLVFWLLAAGLRLGVSAMRAGGEEGIWAAGMLGGCVCFLVDACFNFPFHIIPAGMVFWLFVGALAALAAAAHPARTMSLGMLGPTARKVSLAAAGGLAFFLGAWIAVPALRADHSFAEGLYYRGANMWEMSAMAFRRSLSARPYDSVARYYLGHALFQSGNYNWTGQLWDEAFVELSKAHELGMNDENVYSQMALVFEKKMDFERSIEMSERSLSIYPEGLDVAVNLAYWLSIRERDLNRADALSLRATAAIPEHPLYWWTRGLVLEKLGRYQAALEALEKGAARLSNIANGASYLPELNADMERVRGFTRPKASRSRP